MIPLLSLGVFAAYYASKNTQEQITQEISTVTNTSASLINHQFQSAYSNLQLFTNSVALTRYLKTGDERYSLLQPSLMRQFAKYQKAYPEYFEIRLILPDGFEDTRVVNRDIENLYFDESKTRLFQQLSALNKDDVLTSISRENDTSEIAAHIGRPIYLQNPFKPHNKDNLNLNGYFVLTFDLTFIQDLINKISVGNHGFILITDPNGTLLFQPYHLSKTPSHEELKHLASGKINTVSAQVRSLEEISSYTVSTTQISDQLTMMTFIAEQDLQEVTKEIFLAVLLLVLVVVTSSFLLIFYQMKRLFLEPIYRLKDTMTRIGEGDLTTDLNQTTNTDEFDTLYSSISKMRKSLNVSQQKVKQLAYYDELTGLPNRITLKRELQNTIAKSERKDEIFAVVFVDLDNFKDVNDSLGHDMGDRLLKQVSQRIQKNIRSDDYMVRKHIDAPSDTSKQGSQENFDNIIARLGGDEFTLVLRDIEKVSTISTIIHRIQESLTTPIKLGEHSTTVGASMGIAVYPQDGLTADELLKHADLAMYEAKKAGKNHFIFFNKEMNSVAIQRLALESNLRKALNKNEFMLYYQPRVHTDTGKIEGFEALIRWNSPELGLVPPDQFIPFAEESVLICEIGYWVLDTTCQQIRKWLDLGYENICISVNLSSTQIYRGDTINMIKTVMELYQIPGQNLEIEITESGLLKDEQVAIQFLHNLKALGLRIALDDFGTGYSSLSYLRTLPIDILKIDRSFIKDLKEGHITTDILETIIELADKLSLKTVAEGVETKLQLTILKEFNCSYIQGYYFSKPLPEADALDYLIQSERKHALI
jgi:predicted signal transduction protein with EAL and GGDEF domain